MRCTIENKHLPGLRSICEQPRIDNGDEMEIKHFVRIEVTDAGVSVESPFGGMTAESRVCEPGVVFLPVVWFLDALASVHTNYYIEITASEKKVNVNNSMIVTKLNSFAYFEDPETAPRLWPE